MGEPRAEGVDGTSAHVGFMAHAPEALRRIRRLFPDTSAAARARAEASLGTVKWQSDVDVASFVARDPFDALIAVALLADDPPSLLGARIRAVLPEVAALAAPSTVTTYEHERPAGDGLSTPLLDRVLRALAIAVPACDGLDRETRAVVAATLVFSDVAKGGTPEERADWRARLGVDGTVHNEDSAVIFDDIVRRILGKADLSSDGRFASRVRALCAASGLVGMRLRGEVSRSALAPLHDVVRSELDGGARLRRAWSIVNHAETAAVRRGLWTDELARAFAEEERAILLASTGRELGVAPISERVARMRGGALMRRESIADVEAALERLRSGRAVLESRLQHASIWYAEAALGALSLDASLRLLLHLTGAAQKAGIETTRPWHLDLLGLVPELRDADGEPRRYSVRLLETVLDATKIDELVRGELGGPALLSFPSQKGGEEALAVTFERTEEASALLTLLPIYERKASATFHATLKALCDLYGLRKDDFDRVHNEASYLLTMNAARSDKARMLDFVKPGTIVEVGPGGGVVLDLLAQRFSGSRIVGLDASIAVVEAHAAKHAGKSPGYEVRHGDAFELPTIFGRGEVDTVVFCSVLHEIYSYVEWGEPPRRFQLDAVLALLAAAYESLRPGGRIIVRDGVAPADEPRILAFDDPAWREGFELFAKTYEPRKIPYEPAGDGRVRLSQRDLFEFLTTFTWGPDSFPYEIREQRAVLPRDAYVERALEACKTRIPDSTPREVAVPPDLASYLQPGYPEHLAGHVRIFDASGAREVPMPDVNGVWVIERS
ncbi:MAG TPA: methyltransferase [Polyangiaceae bacterium]|nr:methyltransferase [Polyangiaceae bacterium]